MDFVEEIDAIMQDCFKMSYKEVCELTEDEYVTEYNKLKYLNKIKNG